MILFTLPTVEKMLNSGLLGYWCIDLKLTPPHPPGNNTGLKGSSKHDERNCDQLLQEHWPHPEFSGTLDLSLLSHC